MDGQATEGLLRFFRGIPDRRAANARHPLGDVLGIAILAVLCGAEGWAAVEAWGLGNEPWLATFLDLPRGIPSHDTFDRVFGARAPCRRANHETGIPHGVVAALPAGAGRTVRGPNRRTDATRGGVGVGAAKATSQTLASSFKPVNSNSALSTGKRARRRQRQPDEAGSVRLACPYCQP